jgi:hypothetical protein
MAHRQWFVADLHFQIIKVGLESQRFSIASHLYFYALRFVYAAPLTLILGITALPALVSGTRRRDPTYLILACFLALFSAALLSFRTQSITYLTPLLPVVILIAVAGSPLLKRSAAPAICAAILIASVIRLSNPAKPWGLSYESGSTVPATPILSAYCEERRGNTLYILDVEDQLYAVALPFNQLRYGWVDPSGAIPTTRPHLNYLGIIQDTKASYDIGLYTARLRDWGLNSQEPLGTAISARTSDDLAALVVANPNSDFLVSPAVAARLGGRQAQQVHITTPEAVLLEARVSHPASGPRWTCDM